MNRLATPFWAALSAFALAGCGLHNITLADQYAAPDSIVIADDPVGPVQRAEFSPETWVYRHPDKTPRDYAKVLLSPVRVYENMSTEVKKRDRRYLNQVGETFGRRLERLIEKDYLPVDQPDELTLRIDIELFELKPLVKIFKDRRERTKLGRDIQGTKLEASCYDSVTGELVFAVTTFYEGEEYAAYKNPVLIKNLRGAYGEWSEHFKKRFDEVMTFN